MTQMQRKPRMIFMAKIWVVSKSTSVSIYHFLLTTIYIEYSKKSKKFDPNTSTRPARRE